MRLHHLANKSWKSQAGNTRWLLFRLLEALSELRSRTPAGTFSTRLGDTPCDSLWIYVSTIGELNAIATFTEQLLELRPGLQLVLISDHEHYLEPYVAKHPDAVFFFTRGLSADARLLSQHYPPRLLIIGEIPCVPSDAPCRFSYAYLRSAKRHGAYIAIVNGWLYGHQPACRLDNWEYRLLTRDYLRLVDAACVQTRDVADRMIELGLDSTKAAVTGNMKFDAVKKHAWHPEQSQSPMILSSLLANGRATIVVGCLRNRPEELLTVSAYCEVRKQHPNALLILAHRHPEINENLTRLEQDLHGQKLRHTRRTTHGDTALDSEIDCLILDTMGELKDFYAAATIAHVGADHNLLEPLAFEKPVTTVSEWHGHFPNYPIFQALESSGAISVADDVVTLSNLWSNWLARFDGIGQQTQKIKLALDSMRGATHLTMAKIGENIADYS